jgi:soluble lytic murein transglycosylase-like protein
MLIEFLLAQCPLEPPVGYAGMVIEAAEEFNVNPRLLNTVVVQETRCSHTVVGSQGEVGLVQLHPGIWTHPYNWNWLSSELGWERFEDALDPFQNLRAGAWLLNVNRKLSGGDIHGSLTKYNGSSAYADVVLERFDLYWEDCEL